MFDLVFAVLFVMIVVMSTAWGCQKITGNAGWVDVFWTLGTGVTCASAALIEGGRIEGTGWRHIMIAAMVLVWSLRLGLYVAMRVAKGPEDVRYAYMRDVTGEGFQSKMFALLIVQAPVTAVLSIAVIFASGQPILRFRALDLIGLLIALVAIAGETLADCQMRRFKITHSGQEQVCDRGLWSVSRHPNYLFELIGWFAYPIIGISAQRPWSLLSLLAPALMFLVLRYATGVPALEAAMLRRKGEPYARYQASTGAILPKLSFLRLLVRA